LKGSADNKIRASSILNLFENKEDEGEKQSNSFYEIMNITNIMKQHIVHRDKSLTGLQDSNFLLAGKSQQLHTSVIARGRNLPAI